MSKPRFVPVKDEYQPDGLDCTHPYCERFHANGCPPAGIRVEWYVLDTETGERASITALSDTHRLKRDAQRAIDRYLATA